jgi:hypothetical protein
MFLVVGLSFFIIEIKVMINSYTKKFGVFEKLDFLKILGFRRE